MRLADINPSENVLPEEISDSMLSKAIEASGYPLQVLIAAELDEDFYVTEEWGFIDRETDSPRTLDIYAYRSLDAIQTRGFDISPRLAVLIECKQSRLPFIFFKSAIEKGVPGFPAIAGLNANGIDLHATNRTCQVDPSLCLGLREHSFVVSGPPLCRFFAKASRAGKKIELSGTAAYSGIVLPLMSAAADAHRRAKPTQRAAYPTLLVSVCCLDAPMVLADAQLDEERLELMPWIRVVRQEAAPSKRGGRLATYHVVEFVHRAYLKEYITNHLLPFADVFEEHARGLEKVLLSGHGAVDDLNDWQWESVRPWRE